MAVNLNYGSVRSLGRNSVNNSDFHKKCLLHFCGLKTLDKDTLELSSKKIENSIEKQEKPEYPLNVKIKDSAGKDVDAVITVKTESEKGKQLLLTVNGEIAAHISFLHTNNKFEIEGLYSMPAYPNNKYKGAGTELLKCAVRESIDKGFEGEIHLYASQPNGNPYTPIPFYYKNNFNLTGRSLSLEAETLFSIQNNINVIPSWTSAEMILDKSGAKALLEGKRLYQNAELKKVDEKVINGSNCSAYLFQSKNKGGKCVLIAYKDKSEELNFVSAEFKEQNCNNGSKHFVVTQIDGGINEKEEFRFAMEIIEQLRKKYNYDKTTIKNNAVILRRLKRLGFTNPMAAE